MDLKKMALFLIVIGLIVAAYGGYNLYQIQAQYDRLSSSMRTSLDNLMRPGVERRAAKARKEPIIFLGAGGLIVLLGIGVYVSAKK